MMNAAMPTAIIRSRHQRDIHASVRRVRLIGSKSGGGGLGVSSIAVQFYSIGCSRGRAGIRALGRVILVVSWVVRSAPSVVPSALSCPEALLSCAILEFHGRAAKDFLPRNLRLPDERPRFRKGRWHASLSGIPAGPNC